MRSVVIASLVGCATLLIVDELSWERILPQEILHCQQALATSHVYLTALMFILLSLPVFSSMLLHDMANCDEP
jgi:hypothetical protein